MYTALLWSALLCFVLLSTVLFCSALLRTALSCFVLRWSVTAAAAMLTVAVVVLIYCCRHPCPSVTVAGHFLVLPSLWFWYVEPDMLCLWSLVLSMTTTRAVIAEWWFVVLTSALLLVFCYFYVVYLLLYSCRIIYYLDETFMVIWCFYVSSTSIFCGWSPCFCSLIFTLVSFKISQIWCSLEFEDLSKPPLAEMGSLKS